jgi:hypothetical protein
MSDKKKRVLELMAAVVMNHGGGFRIVGERFFLFDSHTWDDCVVVNINGRRYVEICNFTELYMGLGY